MTLQFMMPHISKIVFASGPLNFLFHVPRIFFSRKFYRMGPFSSFQCLFNIYLFLAALDLHCYAWAFSSYKVQGRSLIVRYWLLPAEVSLEEHRLQDSWALVIAAHGLSSCSPQAPEARLSSRGEQASRLSLCGILLHWDGPGVPHIAKQTCNHWATREAQTSFWMTAFFWDASLTHSRQN